MVASVWQLLFVLLIYIYFYLFCISVLYISAAEKGGDAKTRSVNKLVAILVTKSHVFDCCLNLQTLRKRSINGGTEMDGFLLPVSVLWVKRCNEWNPSASMPFVLCHISRWLSKYLFLLLSNWWILSPCYVSLPVNLCFPITVLPLTLLSMRIAFLTFIFLTVSSVFILFSLQRPFCIPTTIQTIRFYFIQGCKMMSDHMFCSLSCSFNTLLWVFWSTCDISLTFATLTTPAQKRSY